MSTGSLSRLERLCEQAIKGTPAERYVDPERTVRFAEFAAVGGTGAILDLGLTISLLDTTHVLVANLIGFLVAVSFNFGGNWLVTFDRPDGSLGWQYISYVSLHAATFGVRAVVIAALVAGLGVPGAVATVIGVGAAAVANFVASEWIFDGSGRLWFDAVGALNQLAHRVYDGRVRHALRKTGVYPLLYGAYLRVFGTVYRADTRVVEVEDATATLHTASGPEVVSVLHTLEKEREVLDRFVADLRPTDCVWDVGANLGVFTTLAADQADRVAGFEPHPPTTERLEDNICLSRAEGVSVFGLALGDENRQVTLAVERDEVGTQTPTLAATTGTTIDVPQVRGDDLVARGVATPDVVKIDVEGAENEVLDGLERTLREQVRVVYVETHDDTWHAPTEGRDVPDRLEDLGFDVEVLLTDGSQTYLRGEHR